jgi:hypothetical protein
LECVEGAYVHVAIDGAGEAARRDGGREEDGAIVAKGIRGWCVFGAGAFGGAWRAVVLFCGGGRRDGRLDVFALDDFAGGSLVETVYAERLASMADDKGEGGGLRIV